MQIATNNRGRSRGGRAARGPGRGRSGHRGGRHDRPYRGSRPLPNDRSEEQDSRELNVHLNERFGRWPKADHENRLELRNLRAAEASGFDVQLNLRIRQYFEQQNAIDSNTNGESWLRATEIPRSSEINLHDGIPVVLPANRIRKPYKSAAKYIKTQYQLLREDAVSPLRDAIDRFRRNPTMFEDKHINIYAKVHIAGFTLTQNGIAARIKFSIARVGKRILWSASRRLVSGTLVALSPANDNFNKQCLVAVVAARPTALLDRSPPEIDLYFGCSDEAEIDPQKEFIMVEAKTGYYEAHRHTLRALQKLSQEEFPLCDNIIAKSLDIDTPKYLQGWPYRTLASAYSPNPVPNMTNVDVIQAWPESPAGTSLDSTQWESLRHMLTKRLAIVQGPPGTGKTHVSIVALRIMIENRSPDDPPILIAAQTNHALDQLLEHVGQYDPNFIRLGGRSGSDEVKKRALYEIRQKERFPPVPGSSLAAAKTKLRHQQETVFGNILSLFDDSLEPVSAETLFRMGIISEGQKESLEKAVENWISAESDQPSAMRHWLHHALLPFETTYDEESFGFEELEEDLEIEQLKELEIEHGVDDVEDIEMLRGPWKAVFDRCTVAEPSDMEYERAAKLLDTTTDLWKIDEYMRGPVFAVMQQRAKSMALSRFRDAAREYDATIKEVKIGRWEKDAVYLKRANFIGLTTTGLSKYRALIASLQPKIMLVEEAAEVIEAPIAVGCIESLEHLILVGDHLQLRGHCAVSELEGPDYNLNISMFERLVSMQLPFKTLLKQRRMRPEFRALISSLYPELEDHPTVENRDLPQWGTGQIRSFFFTHQWLEGRDDSMSTYNQEEARIVAKLYRYLVQNGIAHSAITVLVFYNGQRKKILKELKKEASASNAYAKVRTVDSYQGEENAIVILSLARSNDEGKMGFLENANRVCVALSRAIRGFYIFGRADLISRNPLWYDVVRQMRQSGRIGDRFPLYCPRHNKKTLLQYPEEWDDKCPEGGCNEPCGGTMPCGHPCGRICHSYLHETMACNELCERILSCGHNCPKLCHESCPPFCLDCAGNGNQIPPREYPYDRGTSTDMADFSRHNRNASKGNTVNRQSVRADTESPTRPVNARPQSNTNFGFGRQLARGGGSFEPVTKQDLIQNPSYLPLYHDLPSDHSEVGSSLSNPLNTDSRPQYQKPHQGSASHAFTSPNRRDHHIYNQSPQRNTTKEWTSFASGGVVEDDKRRFIEHQALQREHEEANRQPPTETQQDLLDLLSGSDLDPKPIDSTTEHQHDPNQLHDEGEQSMSPKGRQRYVQTYRPQHAVQPIVPGDTADKVVSRMTNISLLD